MAALLLSGCDGEGRSDSVTVKLEEGKAASSLPLPAISGARDPRRPLVIIDAGHGGGDPGAVSPTSGRREKDLTLAIAKAVHAELARSGRVRVALTRDGDAALGLVDRYEIARRMGAGLFISIHADAAPHNKAARGASIYTLSEVASDREAALLAQRENAGVGGADVAEGGAVNRILIDLAQRESMETSAGFARLLHREASPLVPFQPDYHRFAALVVLKAPDVPSILFESGYLTNVEDEAFLQSPEGQRRIAEGMRRAVETHFARLSLGGGR
ncbi:N-acetylmuramoyl-L-alanine amidase family protein [Allosphingosinicella sp.]|uniref:N-acetylmuramoyl-L-alanine amidase family protein n=1 Tax=Allosphingosinicella sp. TaxID=2823234 RepID=UPI0039C857B9